jgi:bifunctional non-homologous end joining protein LigD
VPGTTVEVEGRRLTLSNLDKVLYPETGTTKAEVIDYYARIAPVMVPHLADRGVTLRRFPDGVDGNSFFEKRCPGHRPEWLDTVLGPGDRNGDIGYCCLDSAPSLVWAANMAALEIHAPMAQRDIETPTMCVFDLDPGPGAAIAECADVALDIRHVLDGLGLVGVAKTSGSKGMQVYVPLNTPHTHKEASAFALAVAQLLERGQGAGRLEPEQPPQDDGGGVLAAGPPPPDGVDAGRLGRGRGRRGRRATVVRGRGRARARRRARRPLRGRAHRRAAAARGIGLGAGA